MGKLIAILGAVAAVAGGVTYALYGHADLSGERGESSARGACCSEPTLATGLMAQERRIEPNTTPAMAVAGPVALFGMAPAKATHAKVTLASAAPSDCCGTTATQVHACCCDVPTPDHSLQAVVGSAVSLAKK